MSEVRIDKYLWSIRVYKTRSEATDACKGGKVKVNGSDIKPSKAVRPGDMIVARKGPVTYTYRVIELIDKRQGPKLVPNYAENLTPEEEIAKLENLDVYAEYDPLVYDELSRKMFSSFEEIHDLLEYYEKNCFRNKYC